MVQAELSDFDDQYWQRLKQTGLSMQESLLNLALVSIHQLYQVYCLGLGDSQQSETSRQVLVSAALESLQQITTSALVSTENVGVVSETTNTFAIIYFKAHTQAYELLVKQENPDDWLGQFLDTFEEFRGQIGGYPSWLVRPA